MRLVLLVGEQILSPLSLPVVSSVAGARATRDVPLQGKRTALDGQLQLFRAPGLFSAGSLRW